jgi:putative ABC transport system permease protein
LQVKTGNDKGGNVAADIYTAATATVLDLIAFNISIAGFVCIFIVAATVSFAIAQRRQEMALLRLIGATPRQVARMVMSESLVVALIAAAAGSLLAVVCSSGLSSLLRYYGLAPSTFTAGGTWLGSLLASAIGVGVAFIGVFFASRRAGKVRAVEAMRNAVVERRVMSGARWVWGIIFLGASISFVGLGALLGGVAAMSLALFETLLLAVALALLMPVLVLTCRTRHGEQHLRPRLYCWLFLLLFR